MVNEKTRGITFAFNTYFSNEDIFTSNIIVRNFYLFII